MHNKLPDQARKVAVRDDSRACVSQQILQLIFEPQGYHVGCVIKRFNQHFRKIKLALELKRNLLELVLIWKFSMCLLPSEMSWESLLKLQTPDDKVQTFRFPGIPI